MHRRTIQINEAIQKRKERFPDCEVCGDGPVFGAHIVGRNVSYRSHDGREKNDPTCVDLIRSLCWKCHKSYDSNTNPAARVQWWERRGKAAEAKKVREITENL